MLKIVYLARRRPDVDHDDLVTHWRDVNIPQVAAELRPDRYVVTFFDQHRAAGPHAWDGMACVWFDDEDRGRAVADPIPAPARRNGFADLLADVVRLEVDEHTFFDRGPLPPGGRKLTFLVVAHPGVAHQRVVEHWVGVHGPAVAAPMGSVPGARRYVASPARTPAGGYAGVTELYYADRAAAAAHAEALVDDGFTALADNRIFLVGSELVAVER